jgi:predicted ribosomally synthesized peptide with SipW-like signal peptide
MKKIALASAAMGGVALFAFGASGTFASFTDSEEVTATAQAGTMDLQVGGKEAVRTADLGTLNPGETKTVSYWIHNEGSVAGTLLAGLAVTDAEWGCTGPEGQVAGEVCTDWETGGEFSKYATVQIFDAVATDETACKTAVGGTPLLGATSKSLKDQMFSQKITFGALAAETDKCVVLKVDLPDVGNDVQGDSATIKLAMNLRQA